MLIYCDICKEKANKIRKILDLGEMVGDNYRLCRESPSQRELHESNMNFLSLGCTCRDLEVLNGLWCGPLGRLLMFPVELAAFVFVLSWVIKVNNKESVDGPKLFP